MPPRVRIGETPSAEFLEAASKVEAPAKAAPRPGPQPIQSEESFSFILPSGEQLIVGKPRGVMKLKMREQFKDAEIKEIARALLSVKTVGGIPAFIRTPEHFEGLLNRFGSDELVDEFMNEWQKFTNPGMHAVITTALAEAMDKGLVGDALQDYITEAVMDEARKTLEKVK